MIGTVVNTSCMYSIYIYILYDDVYYLPFHSVHKNIQVGGIEVNN